MLYIFDTAIQWLNFTLLQGFITQVFKTGLERELSVVWKALLASFFIFDDMD